jgi:hypothetical protein
MMSHLCSLLHQVHVRVLLQRGRLLLVLRHRHHGARPRPAHTVVQPPLLARAHQGRRLAQRGIQAGGAFQAALQHGGLGTLGGRQLLLQRGKLGRLPGGELGLLNARPLDLEYTVEALLRQRSSPGQRTS